MTKTLWKLQRVAERLWNVAMLFAKEASDLENHGKGFAVVADETRKLAGHINNMAERSLFSEEELEQDKLMELAGVITLLSLNAAIESLAAGQRGKHAAVCAEDIRLAAMEITSLFVKEESTGPKMGVLLPKAPLSSIDIKVCLFQFTVAGLRFVENINNIKEVVWGRWIERTDAHHIKMRGREFPVINGFEMLGKPQDIFERYVILHTPWNEQNEYFAVACDEFSLNAIFYSAVGRPVAAPPGMPLSAYVRECWEAEDNEAFYFMNWPKMV
jgi:hypothetical protein